MSNNTKVIIFSCSEAFRKVNGISPVGYSRVSPVTDRYKSLMSN